MIKELKKYIIILIVLTYLTISSYAVDSLNQSDSFYVADYSNVISDEVEQEIINYNYVLENQCNGAQIVVVTVDYAQGVSTDQYAMKIFNDWEIGSSTYNNGILILLVTQENKYYVQCGLGIDADQLQSSLDTSLSQFEVNFDEKNYSEAVKILFEGILDYFNIAASNYGNSITNYDNNYSHDIEYNNNFGYGYSSFSLISIIIKLFIIFIFIRAIVASFRRSHYCRTGRWLPLFLLFGPRRPSRIYRNYYSNYDPFQSGFGGFNPGNSHFSSFKSDSGFSSNGHSSNFGSGMGHGGGGFGGGGFGRK